jgi:hypothetical protein
MADTAEPGTEMRMGEYMVCARRTGQSMEMVVQADGGEPVGSAMYGG